MGPRVSFPLPQQEDGELGVYFLEKNETTSHLTPKVHSVATESMPSLLYPPSHFIPQGIGMLRCGLKTGI